MFLKKIAEEKGVINRLKSAGRKPLSLALLCLMLSATTVCVGCGSDKEETTKEEKTETTTDEEETVKSNKTEDGRTQSSSDNSESEYSTVEEYFVEMEQMYEGMVEVSEEFYFTVINTTDTEISSVFTAVSGTNEWVEQTSIAEGTNLQPGSGTEAVVTLTKDNYVFDFAVVDVNGKRTEYTKIDISKCIYDDTATLLIGADGEVTLY